MEFRSPPSSARRNPPRRAKAAVLSSASKSHRKRIQTPKLPPVPTPLLSEEVSAKCEEETRPEDVPKAPPGEENPSNPSAGENVLQEEATSDKPEAAVLGNNDDLLPSGNVENEEVCAVNTGDVKNLQVFLRIRPAKLKDVRKSVIGMPKGHLQKRKTQMLSREEVVSKTEHICLRANDSHSVTLTPPPSLLESKRNKTEVYTGFAHVFLPDSSQEDVYKNVMHPLMEDFVGGKSCLLVAMGPTSSGKTHTMFGNLKEPGLIPRVLKSLLASDDENTSNISRSYFISMFEIYSERGRGEKIFDLFQEGAELSLQQSNIKGLQEVAVSSVEEAESFLTQGMQKRTTAVTNANSQSSRSQCIINIRSSPKVVDDEGNEMKLGEAVLTIADLAGAEREKKTGNQGIRFTESNFINNTSMVFGQCLRALLEHQKNPKRTLQKHYHNSLLTRYLKDYLEAKGRMVMVLNVSPAEENYVDTAFVLRQASPYVNIKFNSQLEESSKVHQLKRSSSILLNGVLPKRAKCRHSSIEHLNDGSELLTHTNLLAGEMKDDKVISRDSVAFAKEKNSCGSILSVNVLDRGKEKSCIKDSSSVLIFTQEEFKERISVEVERALQQEGRESHDRLMAAYTESLSNVLKEHKIKVKMMEEQLQTLEEKLEQENKRSVELSNEVNILRERCTYLEHKNEQLQLSINSSHMLTDVHAKHEPDKGSIILGGFGSQNDHAINGDVIIGESSKDTLLMFESETKKVMNDMKAGEVDHMVVKGEQICAKIDGKESDNGNLDKFSQIDGKVSFSDLSTSEISFADLLVMVERNDLQSENRLQSCQDQVCLSENLSVDSLGTVGVGTSQRERESPACEGCGCEDDCTNSECLGIKENNAVTMLVLENEIETNANDFQVKSEDSDQKEQICVRTEEKDVSKENLVNFLQIDSEITEENFSGVSVSENLSGQFLENGENGILRTRNEILSCEDQICLPGESNIAVQQREIKTDGIEQDDYATTTNIKSAITLEVEKEVIFNTKTFPDQSCDGLNILEINLSPLSSKTSQECDPSAKSNLEKGWMLASLLVQGKPEEAATGIDINSTESQEVSKVVSEAYTTSEDDVGPIGQCLEELLGLSPREIENGLWKDDNKCKQKISILLERHGGVLDLTLFNKHYSPQQSLCIRFCFSLICKKAGNDKQYACLSEDIDAESERDLFLAIVKARTVGKAACYAQEGLQQVEISKNISQLCMSQGRPMELQISETNSGNSNQAIFPSNLENPSAGKTVCFLESEKENLFSSLKTPKRKLLPMSSVLLAGIEDDTVEDEMPKVSDRPLSSHKNLTSERIVGNRGRVSLARLLTSNHQSYE